MKIRVITYCICAAFLMVNLSLHAQGNSDGKRKNPPNPHKPPPPHHELPIDAGLSYLLIAGIALGIYEHKRKK